MTIGDIVYDCYAKILVIITKEKPEYTDDRGETLVWDYEVFHGDCGLYFVDSDEIEPIKKIKNK